MRLAEVGGIDRRRSGGARWRQRREGGMRRRRSREEGGGGGASREHRREAEMGAWSQLGRGGDATGKTFPTWGVEDLFPVETAWIRAENPWLVGIQTGILVGPGKFASWVSIPGN